MKTLKIFALAVVTFTGLALASCSDECEYLDNNTNNPSFTSTHPESLAKTNWERTAGMKTNVYGEDVQGFVESISFISGDSCIVKMASRHLPASWSDNTAITWTDDSNNSERPRYEYTYSNITGKLEVWKETVNDKGAVSKVPIFTGIAATGTRNVLTVCHFGDNPSQTYLTQK